MIALPPLRVAHPHVEVAADVMGGSPIVRGTRVPVRRLWAWHRKGVSVETLVRRYPTLGWARVLGALAFAYDNEELVEADLDRERALLETKELPEGAARDVEPVPGRMEQVGFAFAPSTPPKKR